MSDDKAGDCLAFMDAHGNEIVDAIRTFKYEDRCFVAKFCPTVEEDEEE
jgi:hypothetical protein